MCRGTFELRGCHGAMCVTRQGGVNLAEASLNPPKRARRRLSLDHSPGGVVCQVHARRGDTLLHLLCQSRRGVSRAQILLALWGFPVLMRLSEVVVRGAWGVGMPARPFGAETAALFKQLAGHLPQLFP